MRGIISDMNLKSEGFKNGLTKKTVLKVGLEPIEDIMERRKIGAAISPITHISKQSAPSLIIHGDQDKLVSIQQAESFVKKMKEAGAIAELDTRKGVGHGWANMDKDLEKFADWFDLHLLNKTK